jgi:hypothetical protein
MQKRRSRTKGKGHGLLVIAAITVMPWFGCQRDTKQVSTIPYQVVEEWSEGKLFGRTIVIHTAYANENDLRRLGEQLRSEAAAYSDATVEVYNDAIAASSRSAALAAIIEQEGRKLGKSPPVSRRARKEEDDLIAYFQKHRVAEYEKWPTGEELYMFPDGYEGPMITVKY